MKEHEMQAASTLRGMIRRHPGRTAMIALTLAVVGGFALYWFAPWNLFIDRRVDEALPGAPEQVPAATGPAEGPAAPPAEQGSDGPMTLAQGSFASLEHTTTGTALVIELEDGRRFLRLDGLETSSGPDLRVILTDQRLSDDWDIWDDGELVDLGPLKGNIGSSNYEIPTSVDLGDFVTAVIWCRRFSVGFGVAPLESPPA
jgi:Electron transfer DM13